MIRAVAFVLSLVSGLPAVMAAKTDAPLVIAHRGASGYLPEHTLAAYELAIDMGADYIEPDLVITRDGVLVARHEHWLGTTTNVAELPAFANRRREADGRTDWFVEDFTLAELKQLRAVQAFPGRSGDQDGRLPIPTLQEVIDLVKRKQSETGRSIGIYPETKSPAHFESLGHDFAALLLSVLKANDLASANSKVFVQSFEAGILRRLNQQTDLPLVMLVTPASRETPHTPNIPVEEIATFADGVGAAKGLLLESDGSPSPVMEAAAEHGLFVHAWTFRNDDYPQAFFGSATEEIRHYLDIGIDGFFTDFPDTGVEVRNQWMK